MSTLWQLSVCSSVLTTHWTWHLLELLQHFKCFLHHKVKASRIQDLKPLNWVNLMGIRSAHSSVPAINFRINRDWDCQLRCFHKLTVVIIEIRIAYHCTVIVFTHKENQNVSSFWFKTDKNSDPTQPKVIIHQREFTFCPWAKCRTLLLNGEWISNFQATERKKHTLKYEENYLKENDTILISIFAGNGINIWKTCTLYSYKTNIWYCVHCKTWLKNISRYIKKTAQWIQKRNETAKMRFKN